ncbi:hypothetical protein E2C01_002658 [Portunus trituberculatus]|uniref:Uncharacterized protein n=1 Tax=Portunus trituberculatus TaxID=210409 RepID=A0A5B7CRC4_PORTR|nr:hypothetical protein [Portunus trituberculatus]
MRWEEAATLGCSASSVLMEANQAAGKSLSQQAEEEDDGEREDDDKGTNTNQGWGGGSGVKGYSGKEQDPPVATWHFVARREGPKGRPWRPINSRDGHWGS